MTLAVNVAGENRRNTVGRVSRTVVYGRLFLISSIDNPLQLKKVKKTVELLTRRY